MTIDDGKLPHVVDKPAGPASPQVSTLHCRTLTPNPAERATSCHHQVITVATVNDERIDDGQIRNDL
jgi:hypothetical protein